MNNIQYAVILAPSTSHALQVENLFGKLGIRSQLIPIPRHLGSNCGSCVRIAQADKERARQALYATKMASADICDLGENVC